MANLIRKTCRPTKLYLNRPRFVKDMTKHFDVFFRFTVLTAVHLQNANAKFQGRYIIEVRRKTSTVLYKKFTQDNMYQILSQSARFCELLSETFWGVFFGSQCIIQCTIQGGPKKTGLLFESL